MEKIALFEKIESLRCQMIELAIKSGTLTHPEVVAVSQELDIFVLKFQIFLKEKS